MTSIPSSFGVSGSSGPLGQFLTPSGTTASGIFDALSGAATDGSATTRALVAGGLTKSQYKVLSTISAAGASPASIDWNKDGTEPSKVQDIRSLGWIKLVRKVFTSGKATAGLYQLTPVGKAIFKRTSGGQVAASAGDSSTTDSTSAAAAASVTSALQSSVTTVAQLLSSVGVNITV